MGKIRRERKKYHLPGNSDTTHSVLSTSDWKESTRNDATINFLPQAFENIFAGINIPISNVKLVDDTRTIISTTKSAFKDRTANKKERRKLRHQTFIQRINAIQEMKAKKKMKKRDKTLETVEEQGPSNNEPSSSTLETSGPRRPPLKKRGILKSGARHNQMLKNIAALHKMWGNPDFKADPIGSVLELVQEQIVKEIV